MWTEKRHKRKTANIQHSDHVTDIPEDMQVLQYEMRRLQGQWHSESIKFRQTRREHFAYKPFTDAGKRRPAVERGDRDSVSTAFDRTRAAPRSTAAG